MNNQWYLSPLFKVHIPMSLTKLQEQVIHLRAANSDRDPNFIAIKNLVRSFQNKRLRNTYHDLLEDEATATASHFFFEHLYGVGDLEQRDQQAHRVLPKAEQYLPSSAVLVLRKVLEMDLLAEQMDTLMAIELLSFEGLAPGVLSEAQYLKAFRAVGQHDQRIKQIQLVPEVGAALVKLLRFPMLSGLLSMTRAAAQKANLEEFHEFLHAGVKSFKTLKSPAHFFQVIQRREEKLLAFIFEEHILDFPDYQSLSR